MEIIERAEGSYRTAREINGCAREVGVYSVVASLVPRRPSVESEVGRELEAYTLALVRDGVSRCQRTGDPVRSTCPRSVQPVF